MSCAALAPPQDRAPLLRDHGRRVRGHLVRRGPAARAEPEGAAAREPASRRRRLRSRRSSCARSAGGQPSPEGLSPCASARRRTPPTRSVTVRDWQRDWSPDRDLGFYPVDDSRRQPRSVQRRASPTAALTEHQHVRAYRHIPRRAGRDGRPAVARGRASSPRVAVYSRDFEDVRGDRGLRAQTACCSPRALRS